MSGFGYQQFSSIIPFIFIMFLGVFCGKRKLIDSGALKTISLVTVDYLTPFVVINFLQIPKNEKNSSELVWALVSSLVIFAIYYIFAYFFFLRKDNDRSKIYAGGICSSAVCIMAYPLICNSSNANGQVYCALFIFMNQILFNIFIGKRIGKKKNLLKRIITVPFILESIGIILYFLNVDLVLPIANTVNYIAMLVPPLAALLIGVYFSNFPASGFKFQMDIIIVSAFKLLLFPLLTFFVCMLFKFSLETTLLFVILSGLPCGIELPCFVSYADKSNTSCASNLTAVSFVFSTLSIPLVCYITSELYLMFSK